MRRIMIVVEYSIKCCCARFESEDFAILNFVFVALPLTYPQSAIDLLQVFHDTQSGSEVSVCALQSCNASAYFEGWMSNFQFYFYATYFAYVRNFSRSILPFVFAALSTINVEHFLVDDEH